MSSSSIVPSTVGGIKQLATKIKRLEGISHVKALEKASCAAGFENYVHARRVLKSKEVRQVYPVYLSIHWCETNRLSSEEKLKVLARGREILRVDLGRPISSIVSKHRVGLAQGLSGFKYEYEDHLEFRTNQAISRDTARNFLLKAERSLRFMEATGLQPVSLQRHRQALRKIGEMPNRDHYSYWFDPETEECLCLDEPYEYVREFKEARLDWLANNGLCTVEPAWGGIYYPGYCQPYLIGPNKAFLERVAESLKGLEARVSLDPWPHETGLYDDDFVSPERQNSGRPRRRRVRPSYGVRNGAVAYGGGVGIPSSWRPNSSLSFSAHKRLGEILYAARSKLSWRLSHKIDGLRSDLENWSIKELKDQYGDDAWDLYYRLDLIPLGGRDALLSALNEARGLILEGYNECKPRQEVLSVLDRAIREAEAS